jgi:filamentous hemagglutinin
MTGIEHIMYRHGPSSGFKDVSRFAQGTRMGDIRGYVDSALRNGKVTANGTNGFKIEYNVGKTIGTDVAGTATSNIRVLVRDGIVQTAFPF